ncbi:MAG: hypothetical protein AB2417_09920 [Clostridiaceae bacterium]
MNSINKSDLNKFQETKQVIIDENESLEEYIQETLDRFYINNNIQGDEYLSDGRQARQQRKRLDRFIGKDILMDNLKKWLDSFAIEDQKYLLKLIERYTYITQVEMEYMMYELYETIEKKIAKEGYNMSDSLFITVESGVKSGGDNIRTTLQMSNINRIIKGQIISAVSKIDEDIIKRAKVIIFIDDIIGTGNTSFRNIRDTCKRFENLNIRNKKIILACICAKQKVVKKIIKSCKKEGIDLELIICKEIQSCFVEDNNFKGKEREEVINIIKKYEQLIDEASKTDERTYYLGFEKSKVLISFYYETPNNTLCNFWKYSCISTPLFPRQVSTRPTIYELKHRKEINSNNAYNAGKVKKNEIL